MPKIEFHYELDFRLHNEERTENWICDAIGSEKAIPGELSFIFVSDEYLLDLHQRFMNKDSLTDILTFDYSEDGYISGDIFISVSRVRENAIEYKVEFEEELNRVMIHGVLHLLGYDDRDEIARLEMRKKEDEKLKMFHVEQ